MPSRPATRKLRLALVGGWLCAALSAAWWMSPPASSAVAGEASRLRAAGRIDEAAALLTAASPGERRDPAVLELLGGLERDRGRLREAEAAFRAALHAEPSRAEATLGLGALIVGRDPAAAVTVLGRLRAASLTTAQRHRWLSLVAESGNATALASAAAAASAVAPRDPVALTRAMEAAEQRHAWSDVVTYGRRLAALERTRRDEVLSRVAHAQEAQGALREALATYESLDAPGTWRRRVRLLSATGRTADAANLWKARADEPLAPEARLARAHAYQQAGWTRDAEADYRGVLAAGAMDATSRARFAWMLNALGRHADAWAVASPLPPAPVSLEVLAFTAAWAGADARAGVLLPRWLERHPRDVTAWRLLVEVSRRRGDDAQRAVALRSLASLEPATSGARLALARHLSAGGNTDAAIAEYQRIVVADATPDVRVLEELSVLLEQRGRFGDALAVLGQLRRADPHDAALLLREARVRRWSGDPAGAADALRGAIALEPAKAGDRQVQADLARVLADAGDWNGAAVATERALAGGAADPELLWTAAQAETRRGRPARAVAHLQQLARARALTPDEQRWLAGQAEEAGLHEVAVAEYGRLLASGGDVGSWQKIAELEARQGRDRASLDAWARVPRARRPVNYWRVVTWTASRVGPEAAMVAYADAHADGAADAALWLEAARLHASADQASDAVTWYERHLTAAGGSTAGLELELAQAYLAVSRPEAALEWLQQARAAGVTGTQVRFLEAQARHLAGQPREASRILAALVDAPEGASAPTIGEWFAWLGRTSQARGRLLDAYLRYGDALQRGARPAGEFRVARGDIAAARGDVRRADENYTEALAAGDEQARSRLDALDAQRQSAITIPGEVFRDTNDFRHASAGGRFALRPGDRGRLTGEWSSGRVSQGATMFTRAAGTLAIDRVFPTERTTVAGQVGVESARGAMQPLWRVDGGYQHPNGAAVQVEGFRESPWRAETWDARMRYNRITDLAVIPGDFHAHGSRITGVVPVGEHQEVVANAAVRTFSDGNRQVQGYLQYQVPLSSDQATWVAIQPYGYVEQWQRTEAAYFSPDRQVTVGATVRAILSRGPWVVDLSGTPQYLDSASRSGLGYAAVASVRRVVGRATVGATGMVFDDRKMKYRVQRVTMDVQVPVGR